MSDFSNNKIILLADDDLDDRELFCEALSSCNANITIHCTENGSQALKKLDELTSKPDMIFLDINMPVMDGWECLKMLKENASYRHIPVIIYSSSSDQREKEIAIEQGASLFFTKPNDFHYLKKQLEVIVNCQGLDQLKKQSFV